MNKERINQILTVLLFPFYDPLLGSEDPLLEKYQEYERFLHYQMEEVPNLENYEALISNYRRAERKLQHYLKEKVHSSIRSYDDLLQLCELYYPIQKLRQMTEAAKHNGDSHSSVEVRSLIGLFYYENIFRIADSLITYRDGIASIRTWNNANTTPDKQDIFDTPYVFNKVEIWNLLCRFTVPDIYIVAFAVQCDMEIKVLYNQKPFISLADKLLAEYLRKGLAENHMHSNVGFNYAIAWLYQVNPAIWERSIKRQKTLESLDIHKIEVTVFRLLSALFLKHFNSTQHSEPVQCFEKWLYTSFSFPYKKEIFSMLTDMEQGLAIYFPENTGKILEELIHNLQPNYQEMGYDYLLETIYREYIELKTSSEFIFLYYCLQYINKQTYKDLKFIRLFLQYIRMKNALFRRAQQTNEVKGLLYFQNYFNSSKDMMRAVASSEVTMLEILRSQSQITSLKKLELRVAPNVHRPEYNVPLTNEAIRGDLSSQIHDIFYVYRRYILENLLGVYQTGIVLKEEKRKDKSYLWILDHVKNITKNNRIVLPTLGIVFHFLKKELLDNTSGYFCWKKNDGSSARYSSHGITVRNDMSIISRQIEFLRSTIPYLDEYIVGIDAASDENAMEPWMFVPTYIQMRSRNIAKPLVEYHNGQYRTIQNIGFTYHVGEDFRHILSGLRHIDEVIEHFHYKPGDRLGHAIALGINVKKWAQNNEVVALPIIEHMENLLWMWGKNVYDNIQLPIQLENLEEQIMRYAQRIYLHPESLTIRMLYEAYCMKFKINHKKIIDEISTHDESCCTDNTTFCKYSSQSCNINSTLWSPGKLLSTYYCPVFEIRYHEIILIPVPREEIAAYEILQEHLLLKTERKGIYIETNPTSNITIGDLDSIYEHPIFRMNSLQTHTENTHYAMVTINSDDPAVFNTNVENELAYIYHAADYEGVPKERILKWIDNIRQNGMSSSFIKQEKDCLQLLEEISIILDKLKTNIKSYAL